MLMRLRWLLDSVLLHDLVSLFLQAHGLGSEWLKVVHIDSSSQLVQRRHTDNIIAPGAEFFKLEHCAERLT